METSVIAMGGERFWVYLVDGKYKKSLLVEKDTA